MSYRERQRLADIQAAIDAIRSHMLRGGFPMAWYSTRPVSGITVSEWIDRWLATQDVGVSTEYNREYLIRRFVRPVWGASPLNSLSTEEVTRWENGLPARAGISRRTARDARSLLGTILGDAAAMKPPLIPYNPALRPRNRGRRTGRKLDRLRSGSGPHRCRRC